MTSFLSWYLFITLLGWLTFPLAYRLFPALADRGYALSRAAGLLLWGFLFWWMASLGIVMNDLGGLLLALAILAGLSLWAVLSRRDEVVEFVKQGWKVILTTEVLFLAAFAFMAYVRAANPDILGTEKPMELAFINAILRSPTFPPRDPWLSGWSISYYYFGYVLTAMLARITSVAGTAAFNLMLALVFGLAAIGAYGVLYNLLAVANHSKPVDEDTDPRPPSVLLPLLAPIFLLLVSNVEGFLEILHRRGLFWTFNADGSATSAFWTWLDIRDLNQAPTLPLGGVPQRFWWWWRASRVIQDTTLSGEWKEIIDEFPAFSFVLGDLHPHVLALPFGLLVVAVALNLFLGGWRGSIPVPFLGARIRISPLGFAVSALVLGGLAFLNVWDILAAGALVAFAYLLFRVRQEGWNWARLEDLLLFGLPLAVSAFLLYLPFYVGFSSQAGGLLPNLVAPSRGAQLWVMFGTLFLPLFVYLLWLIFTRRGANWRPALYVTLGLPLALWALSWLLGLAATAVRPDVAQMFLAAQGVSDTSTLFMAASARRLLTIGGLLTLMALLLPTLAFLFQKRDEVLADETEPAPAPALDPTPFILLLILWGLLFVMLPEFVYLRDQFGWRMNTIFKFYYQAWMWWSLAASFGIAVMWKRLRLVPNVIFTVFVAVILVVGLAYPVMAFPNKTDNFKVFSLDDFDRVKRDTPDEAAAMQFLMKAEDGVVAEASLVTASYSGYSRISTYTGLPTVIGWPMHEGQWRGTSDPQGNRLNDLITLYSTPNWSTARQIIEMYHIRYIVIGYLERTTYTVEEQKFFNNLPIVFQNPSVTIYEAPQPADENR
jgi:YYY domain-containing protein